MNGCLRTIGAADLKSITTALLVSLVLLLIALHAFSLQFFPPVFVDEALLISRALAWIETGLNYSALDSGVFEKRFDGYWTFHPIIPTSFHALFVYIFGLDLSLLRFSSFLCGIVLLMSVSVIGLQLNWSLQAVVMSAFLLTTSYSFLVSAHLVRYDIIVSALAYTAIALQLRAIQKRSVIAGTLSGLLLGAAFEVHMNAVIFGPILIVPFLTTWGWQFYRERVFWGFTAGTTFVLIGYACLHVLRYPEAYFGIGRALAGTHAPPLYSGDLFLFVSSISEMGKFLFVFSQGRIVPALIAALFLLKTDSTKTPLLMLITALLAFTLLIKSKMYYYMILISPLVNITLAQWFDYFIRRRNGFNRWDKVVSTTIIALVVASVLLSLNKLKSTFSEPLLKEPQRVAKSIERFLPVNGSIMGPQTYWFYLHQYRYISWQNILAYRLYEPQSTLWDAMLELRPDILVIDDHLREFILTDRTDVPRSGFERYAWERRLDAVEFDGLLKACGRLEERIETKAFGAVEIYSLYWGSSDSRNDNRPQSQSSLQPSHQTTCRI